MSDIPVGSPPVPPGRHAAPSGWYVDPVDGRRQRYWDGWQWSRDTREAEPPAGSYPPPSSPSHQQPGQYPQQPGQYGQQPYQDPQQPGQYPTQPYGSAPAGYGLPGGQPVPRTADGVLLAGWWWRVLAVVIDNLILGVLTTALTAPIWLRWLGPLGDYWREAMEAARAGAPTPPPPPMTMGSPADNLVMSVISVTCVFLYSLLFWRLRQATPGKLVCGLRVVPAEQGQYRGPLTWTVCLVRAAIWAVPSAATGLLVFRLIDVLWPLFGPKRQALHDLAAKTQVVKIN